MPIKDPKDSVKSTADSFGATSSAAEKSAETTASESVKIDELKTEEATAKELPKVFEKLEMKESKVTTEQKLKSILKDGGMDSQMQIRSWDRIKELFNWDVVV